MANTSIPGIEGGVNYVMLTDASGNLIGSAVLSGTFNRATAVSSTPGNALLVTGVTTAGTVSITLTTGTVTVSVGLGSTILPFGARTGTALGTAVGGTFQSLFFS